jgi:hypothetical protein
MAQPGAGAAQIVRGKVFDAGPLRSTLDNMPDRLRRDRSAPKFAYAVYSPENRAGVDAGGYGPCVNRSFHPCRDRNCADMLSFSDQVRDHLMLLPDLEIFRLEGD